MVSYCLYFSCDFQRSVTFTYNFVLHEITTHKSEKCHQTRGYIIVDSNELEKKKGKRQLGLTPHVHIRVILCVQNIITLRAFK